MKVDVLSTQCMHGSMLEYSEKLQARGVETGNICFVRIGRSVYTYLAYVNANGDWAMALKPCYRTDWVTGYDAGPYPALLPAAYKHAPNRTVFEDPNGQRWYIAGWSNAEQVLWLHPAIHPEYNPKVVQIHAA